MKHLFKLDPAKNLPTNDLTKLIHSGTDGFIIGGTDNIQIEAVQNLYEALVETDLPIFLEVSDESMILPEAEQFLIPVVLNTENSQWTHGLHKELIKEVGDFIPWKRVTSEGYVILNKDAKVAHLTEAKTDLTDEDIVAYARLAENIFRLPIFYVEYSGMYGDPEVARKVSTVLDDTKFWYGGGIRSKEQAAEMAKYADTIIVGNIIYEDLEKALETASIFTKKTV
ncbi:heptaprenylglyceryl phosphate synthase [Listeria cossartiae subsp. cayugensis]|uniref:heptaprenylglyceryl phosphate synthase n=1 Tax=Listeria cossartiae TaxID=2838249 RepID=UPI00288080BF|nr:heptaprenylglyceryl phosphate synthase [Listeria cossartiae]MDT0004552.1 heptaprenylglyceryl phosphate synthase [Listeria cossartiae subsp. cayugensis]MDT0015541.1 heptaprenylglyceryl phosphate synthase [Listeria cossartiae subsp. cayugensis]MDT0020889.1 heptaprenylglyceryl phosphate synthase [Listeria cossartiae subsp. cayugensis]MDT0037295.1 heptaprenylglyceryl phosphate synthase [Listeria cossartiae subsp. cayugensis]MDT0042697.1 heptaprenylglyceryl phosphate synthase [Listeria cossartia